MVMYNNALIINIPLQSGKWTLKYASAASFTAAANRFLFHIETTQVKITQGNIGNFKEVLAPDCHFRHLLPTFHLIGDDIRTPFFEKEAILEDQPDTLSQADLEKEPYILLHSS